MESGKSEGLKIVLGDSLMICLYGLDPEVLKVILSLSGFVSSNLTTRILGVKMILYKKEKVFKDDKVAFLGTYTISIRQNYHSNHLMLVKEKTNWENNHCTETYTTYLNPFRNLFGFLAVQIEEKWYLWTGRKAMLCNMCGVHRATFMAPDLNDGVEMKPLCRHCDFMFNYSMVSKPIKSWMHSGKHHYPNYDDITDDEREMKREYMKARSW